MKIENMEVVWEDRNPVINMKYADLRITDISRTDRRRLEQCIKRGAYIDIRPDYDDYSNDIKVVKVIYHNPATIVFWSDETKTVVKCDENDTYDPEKGFYIACAKKLFGNNYKAVGRMNKALEMAITKGDNT